MFNSHIKTNVDKQVKIKMEEIRSQYLTRMINAIFIAAIVSTALAFYSYTFYFVPFISVIPIVVLLLSGLLVTFKNKLSESIKSYCITSIFVTIAVISWFLYGVNGGGILWLFLSCITIMSLHGFRAFILYIFLFLLYIAAIFLFHLQSYNQYIIGIFAHQSEPLTWFSRTISISTIIILVTYALYNLQNNLFTLVNTVTKQKAQIDYLANHDTLTSLPTIRLADERLAMAISFAKRNKRNVGVLFLDLDGFKLINDTYGHQVGDKVLVEVAKRLKEQCRGPDTICRIGGDEFLIVLSDVENVADIDIVCQRLIKEVCQKIMLENDEVNVGASIGVAIYPNHSDNVNELKSLADKAMYKVKKSGKNNYAIYAS